MRKKQIVGNWKMQKNAKEVEAFFQELGKPEWNFTPWIAPQALHISSALEYSQGFSIGAQNCAYENSGAFTGENSPAAIKDLGAEFVLIGHSERRSLFDETPTTLKQKTMKAMENGLKVIFCIGEQLEEREEGKTFEVLKAQILDSLSDLDLRAQDFLLAYEPVWAVGTGQNASPEQAAEAHAFCRETLKAISSEAEQIKILYGGSVKPANVDSLLSLEQIDGALVGGASLKASDFRELCECAASKNE